MKYILNLFFLLISISIFGQLSVAKIFSDNMVLQRDVAVPVWGWAPDYTPIQLDFNGHSYQVIPVNGEWEIVLPAHKKGAGFQLSITTLDTVIKFNNIAYGDVWLCGGQSNMEWTVENSNHAAAVINQAQHPNIRLFEVPHQIAHQPVTDLVASNWAICDSHSVKQFSAVGYFFGRHIHQSLDLPIGLLSNNFGGTVIETWMSPNAFEGMPNFQHEITKLATTDLDKIKKEGKTKFDKWLRHFSTKDAGKKGEAYIWQNSNYTDWAQMELPNIWESNGIQKFKDLNGVVWFQKTINLTAEQLTKGEAVLSLGTIDDSDVTWINGIQVGKMHNRYNKDRLYQIKSNVLKSGPNSIVVRVEDYIGGGGLYGDAAKLFLSINNTKISLAGHWQYKLGYQAKTALPMGAKFGPNSFPTLLYNGMIAPIQKFPIKGVIWYQGESNAGRASEYKSLFINWIKDWRKLWKNKELPFIWVQLANFQQPQTTPTESNWAELRASQQTGLTEPNTAMITAIDLGSANTIHPLNKQDVGYRLAQAALAEVYLQPISYKSPQLNTFKTKRKYIDLTFYHTFEGLSTKSKYGYVKGFTIAGKDKKFNWAQAQIIAPNTIRVFAPKGMRPKAVRYAWANNPDPANVINSIDMPLLPFRTDSWKVSTQGIIRK